VDAGLSLLVYGDDADAAERVRATLAARAGTVEVSLDAGAAAAAFERLRPDVVVLACGEAEASKALYFRLMRESLVAQTHPHRAVVLCRPEEAEAFLALCVEGHFHDYVPCGTDACDPWRLPMAVHAAAVALRETAVGRRQTILVVDDDAFVAKLIGKALAGALPVETEFAESATAGLAFLRRMKPALILMDVNMPGMDGVSMTEWLKSTPSLARIPVIMLTGDATRETIERSRAAGAADFIVKPFSRDGLIAKISRHVH
jgi:two-component system chemotaxis response regulator CheY